MRTAPSLFGRVSRLRSAPVGRYGYVVSLQRVSTASLSKFSPVETDGARLEWNLLGIEGAMPVGPTRTGETTPLGAAVFHAPEVDRALKTLDAASKAERKLTYTEPPYYPRPVAEALGHLALRNNKPAIAEKAYRAALEQYPGDAHARKTIVGQAQAHGLPAR